MVTTVSAFSDPHTFNLPTVGIGDRIVLVCSILDSLAATTPVTDMSAWTSFLASELNAFHTWRGWTIYIADAAMATAWSGGTVVVNSDNGGKSTAVAVRVTDGANGAIDVAWDHSGPSATGGTNQADPPQLVPGWSGTSGYDDHTLWLTFATFGSGGSTATAQPQDYQDLVQGSPTGSCVTAVAWRQTIAGGEDPGAFQLSGFENNQALTFAVRPVQVSAPTLFTVGLAGAITAAGALTRSPAKALVGAVASSGALSRSTAKALGGTITRLGTLTLRTAKGLGGSTSPAGALTTVRLRVLALAGSIGLGGTLSRSAAKGLAGTVSPSGSITRRALKALGGSVTPSGAFSSTRTKLLALAGSIGPSGAVSRLVARSASGATTPAGSLTKRPSKLVAGLVTPSGVLTTVRLRVLALAGSISPSGALTRRTAKALAGAVAPQGGLVRRVGKNLVGLLSLAGLLDSVLVPGGEQPPLGEGHNVAPIGAHDVAPISVHGAWPTTL